MKKPLISAVKGTRDFYPADMRTRRTLLRSLQKTLELAGYEEYDAPLLESLELYAAKSSTEIVERQSYVFEDRGDERLVVRPEMTPSLARMIASKQRELVFPLRWYSFPECWRYERPQKGRLRNFLQANVDLIGSDSIEADVEVIDIALSMVRNLGADLTRIEVRLNDRGLLNRWLEEGSVGLEKRSVILSLLDERDKLEPEDFRSQLLACMTTETADVLIQRLSLSEAEILLEPGAERLRAVQEGLRIRGWKKNIRINPTIIRGFSYYTGIVFEVYETSGSFRRAAFGGGRYDNLVEAVGGAPVAGVGFAASDVSLKELLAAQGREIGGDATTTFLVAPFSEAEVALQNEIAASLRKAGIGALTSLPPYGFSTQLKQAQRQGLPYVILIGPAEVQEKQVILRTLASGEQRLVPLEQLVSVCQALL